MNFQQLIDSFNEHANEILDSKSKTAKFRASAYTRVANKLESEMNPTDCVTKEKIEAMEISDYMKTKALELAQKSSARSPSRSPSRGRSKTRRSKTSSSKKSPVKKSSSAKSSSAKSPVKKSPTVKNPAALLKELTEFMGIGPEKAKALMQAGVTNINQLHMKKYKQLLPEETKVFMDLKPLQKIPTEHIAILEPYIMKAAGKNLSITIVGSYRRKKPFSSDIDLMIVSEDENAIQTLLTKLSDVLNKKVYPYSKGKDKMSLIVDMSDLLGEKNMVYKIDAFRTTKENSVPMLLYSTGSKEFNVSMRSKAKKMGYLLNQKGLFKDGEKVPDLNSEKDYFDILEMDYKEPKQRT
jgi:DNA polymerase/3'-5' exonuclease PolX